MIVEYHRPDTLQEALELLARTDPVTRPLGGGGELSQARPERYAVVDVQRLGLAEIERQGNLLRIGGAITLQALYQTADIQPALREAVRLTVGYNRRQTATLAGALVSARGNSPLAVALLALDARLIWQPGEVEIGLGDYLPLRASWKGGQLMTHVVIPVNVGLGYEYVARTPADQPIVSVALAQWPGGRARATVGLPGGSPGLALDGLEAAGVAEAVQNAYSHLRELPVDTDEAYLIAAGRALAARLQANRA